MAKEDAYGNGGLAARMIQGGLSGYAGEQRRQQQRAVDLTSSAREGRDAREQQTISRAVATPLPPAAASRHAPVPSLDGMAPTAYSPAMRKNAIPQNKVVGTEKLHS